MSNIPLFISGNLTGFSYFYVSPVAMDMQKEIQFDFDYRNYLTFLRNGDKAYALSFAPTAIAVSLVTRILDSFHRPGVLVVTVLLPRRKKVMPVTNVQNDKALYQLLNAVHDRFCEKNVVNGMAKESFALLEQDYYSDILANYALVQDERQRPVNTSINVSLINKRTGYIQSAEENVPLYLSSLCRKSYEGLHHVFIAEKAQQNLDEAPEEVVLYTVKVMNNGTRIPSVLLTDKIFQLAPAEGECDIDKNFTYQQVLSGEAGRNITATIDGETIEITYHFGKETREIKFTFFDGRSEVPFTSVCPKIVYSDGRRINISNENWTFEGKEIYEARTIESGSRYYVVKPESARLEIRRLQNSATCLIQVEPCSPIDLTFPSHLANTKRITFRRSDGMSKTFEVGTELHELLPGKQEEYSYTIESAYYETLTGILPPLGQPIVMSLKQKENRTSSYTTTANHTHYGNDTNRQVAFGSEGRRTNSGTSIIIRGGNPSDTFQPDDPKKDNKKLKYVLFGVLSVALIVGSFIFMPKILNHPKAGQETSESNVPDSINKQITLTFEDSKNKTVSELPSGTKVYIHISDLIDITDSIPSNSNLKYRVNCLRPEISEGGIKVTVSLEKITISKDTTFTLNLDEPYNDEKFEMQLNVTLSELELYTALKKENESITEAKRKDYELKIDSNAVTLKLLLETILEKIPTEAKSLKKWSGYLTGTYGTIDNLRQILKCNNEEYEKKGSVTVTQRANALISVLESFQEGVIPDENNCLSIEQNAIIEAATNFINDEKQGQDRKNAFFIQLKKIKGNSESLGQIKELVDYYKQQ